MWACSMEQKHYIATVYQSLMVWSSGRPGHLRLLPDNEYDEDDYEESYFDDDYDDYNSYNEFDEYDDYRYEFEDDEYDDYRYEFEENDDYESYSFEHILN